MKIILVDAVDCFVSDEGEVFADMKTLLDSYPNRKIILTNAPDEKFTTYGLDKAPYEVFTLRRNPMKTDPKYFELMLSHFGLDKSNVIYFEHSPEAVESARNAGIETYLYDNAKKDLSALRLFLDTNLKS